MFLEKGNADKICASVLNLMGAVLAKDGLWQFSEDLHDRFDLIGARLADDYRAMCAEGMTGILFRPLEQKSISGMVGLFRSWHLGDGGPSLPAMILSAAGPFGLDLDMPAMKAALIAGFLGEVENVHPYHGNIHYRKVLSHAIRMIAAHNAIHEGTARVLKPGQIALLMAAAAIHDLDHDGKGNGYGESYVRSRLEQRSCMLAEPYMFAAGLVRTQMDDLETIILCTEVTPIDSPSNPMRQMKAAWRHYFGEGPRPILEGKLRRLYERPDLVQMATLLHEADIATSAGMTYEVTKFETALFRQEMGFPDSRPWHVMSFMENVCDGEMLTEAGKRLMDRNMETILLAAKKDYDAGDQPYLSAEHSSFLHPAIIGEIRPKMA